MTVKFYKYQGTGNDFIMIDNRAYGLNRGMNELYASLCHRRFGIGADGLILLQDKPGYDFEMVYFNSDGRESTMCGNGGRCIIRFAHDLGMVQNNCSFLAVDGAHEGKILSDGNISLKMIDVTHVEPVADAFVMNTGSPHFVSFVNELAQLDVVNFAKGIRYNERFAAQGINVNFVEKKSASEIYVRTYERGVEDETLSCGTGVVACSIATAFKSGQNIEEVKVETLGGNLTVRFVQTNEGFSEIYLEGPAERVFEGNIVLQI